MGGCGAVLWIALAAADPVAEDEQAKTERQEAVNPARLIPRLEVRQRYTALDGGGKLHTTALRMDVVLSHRLLLRYEMPLVVQRAADGTRSGIGDIRVSAIGLLTSGPRHAAALIAGLALDSASLPTVGVGKQRVIVGGAGAVKPRPWWLLYAVASEQVSFAGDATRTAVNELFFELGNAIFGGQGQWFLLDLDTIVDLEGHATRLIGALEAGRLLIGRVGLFVRGGTQLLGPRQVDGFVDSGVRYLFGLK
jgi:hypothetical protein